MRALALLAASLAAALLAGCAGGGKRPDYPSDWEQAHARELGLEGAAGDAGPSPPAYPRK